MLDLRKAAPQLPLHTVRDMLLAPLSFSVGIDYPTLMSLMCAARSVRAQCAPLLKHMHK